MSRFLSPRLTTQSVVRDSPLKGDQGKCSWIGELDVGELSAMSVLRAIVCILLPPLAVYDKGCGPILIVLVLTLLGWIPGIIGAMIFCTREPV